MDECDTSDLEGCLNEERETSRTVNRGTLYLKGSEPFGIHDIDMIGGCASEARHRRGRIPFWKVSAWTHRSLPGVCDEL